MERDNAGVRKCSPFPVANTDAVGESNGIERAAVGHGHADLHAFAFDLTGVWRYRHSYGHAAASLALKHPVSDTVADAVSDTIAVNGRLSVRLALTVVNADDSVLGQHVQLPLRPLGRLLRDLPHRRDGRLGRGWLHAVAD